MANIADRAKKWVDDAKSAIESGSQQTDSLGSELAARAQMNRAGEQAASGAPTAPPVKGTSATPVNPNAPKYGSRSGEKRIDTTEMTKPLGSFAKGTNSVPQTGVYKVHKGEKVVPVKGAPADFGGPVFPNPTGIKPAWDTDKPTPPKAEPHGAKGDVMTPEEMRNPIASFAKGTDSVPRTGVYKVHEGEKVVSKKDNMGHSPEEKQHFHRAMHALNEGGLHRHLGIPEDQPIPMEKKQAAANSDNKHVAAMGRMAVAMHGWNHGKK